MRDYKSLLFTPAIRKDRFIKALNSNASNIILDLEDSINADQKSQGRENIIAFCKECLDSKQGFFIRINAIDTPFYKDDIALLKQIGTYLHGIFLPKAQSSSDIESLLDSVSLDIPIIPLIESIKGMKNLESIATTKGVKMLSFGALDMALDLGLRDNKIESMSSGMQFALNNFRLEIAMISRMHGLLAPINGVYPHIENLNGLREDMHFAYCLGFGGSLCIHPKQIDIINEIFGYGDAQIAWAREIMRLAKIHNNEVFSYEGKMIDMPVIKKAQEILDSIDSK